MTQLGYPQDGAPTRYKWSEITPINDLRVANCTVNSKSSKFTQPWIVVPIFTDHWNISQILPFITDPCLQSLSSIHPRNDQRYRWWMTVPNGNQHSAILFSFGTTSFPVDWLVLSSCHPLKANSSMHRAFLAEHEKHLFHAWQAASKGHDVSHNGEIQVRLCLPIQDLVDCHCNLIPNRLLHKKRSFLYMCVVSFSQLWPHHNPYKVELWGIMGPYL